MAGAHSQARCAQLLAPQDLELAPIPDTDFKKRCVVDLHNVHHPHRGVGPEPAPPDIPPWATDQEWGEACVHVVSASAVGFASTDSALEILKSFHYGIVSQCRILDPAGLGGRLMSAVIQCCSE